MDNGIEPRLIEVFRAVVETGSATLAGERLRMTQPSVTRAVAQLEERTGLDLFERGRFGMRLTAVGELFAEEVRASFTGLDRLTAAASALRRGLRGRIVIAALPIHAQGLVAELVGDMMRDAPDLSVRIEELSLETAVRRLTLGEVDIAIAPGPVSSPAQLHGRTIA